MRKKTFMAISLVMLLLVASVGAHACTSILVTPDASVDGSASVTHTCDSGNSPFEIVKVPAQDWEPGTMIDVLYLPSTHWAIKCTSMLLHPPVTRFRR